MLDQTTRIYLGTDDAGKRRRKSYQVIADQFYKGSVSKMVTTATDEKWGINPQTGDFADGKSPTFPTGVPNRQNGKKSKIKERAVK